MFPKENEEDFFGIPSESHVGGAESSSPASLRPSPHANIDAKSWSNTINISSGPINDASTRSSNSKRKNLPQRQQATSAGKQQRGSHSSHQQNKHTHDSKTIKKREEKQLVEKADVEVEERRKHEQTKQEGEARRYSSSLEFVTELRKKRGVNLGANEAYVEGIDRVRMKRQHNDKRCDSYGSRVPDELQVRFFALTDEEAVHVLCRSIIYHSDDIIVLNKPNGIAVQGVVEHHTERRKEKSIGSLLPLMTQKLRLDEPLHIVHRLDKDTTGVLLLAKTASVARELRNAFSSHLITKTYVCIAAGVPPLADSSAATSSISGIVDIPLRLSRINSIEKMMPCAKLVQDETQILQDWEGAREAVTAFTVLDKHFVRSCPNRPADATTSTSAGSDGGGGGGKMTGSHVSLMQCASRTGVRHQIRSHLAQGLACPILGDHKYASLSKLQPQRLSAALLAALRIRPSKARYLRMNLHAHTLHIGGGDGGALEPLDKFLGRDFRYEPFDLESETHEEGDDTQQLRQRDALNRSRLENDPWRTVYESVRRREDAKRMQIVRAAQRANKASVGDGNEAILRPSLRNFSITAGFPDFMLQNMRRLSLKLPKSISVFRARF